MFNKLFLSFILGLFFATVDSFSTKLQSRIPEEFFNQALARSDSISNKTNGVRLRSAKSSTLLEPIIIRHKANKPKSVASSEKVCEGACITPRSCDHHGGVSKGFCAAGTTCCQFKRSCGEVSREKVSFFSSPQYPETLNGSLDCLYQIYPSEHTCALRVEFISFKLKDPVKTGNCAYDALYILNTDQGFNEPICEMENHTAIIFVKQPSPKPVKFLLIAQSQSFKWNLKISQINCHKLQNWTNEPKCGRQLMYEDDDKSNSVENESIARSGEGREEGLDLHPYIVNGRNAENREFPWQISLQTKKGFHRCGGSILNENYILTAAHCVARNAYSSPENLKVVVGDYNLNGTDDGGHQEFAIEKIIAHYHYKPLESHINDIAILKLSGALKFSPNIQPVCLPSPNHNASGTVGLVSGWGRLNGTDPSATASTLQKLEINIIPDEECRALVQEEVQKILHRNITSSELGEIARLGFSQTQICGRPPLTSAVCFGDSGGPLVTKHSDDGSYMQVGIVSYGLGKCVTNRNPPAAYTKVTAFLDFIAIATMEE